MNTVLSVRWLLHIGTLGLLCSSLIGCDAQEAMPPDPDQLIPSESARATAKQIVSDRPYDSKIPLAYDASRNWPLVILLHGYGANGLAQDLYFGIGKEVDRLGFLYAFPDGTNDSKNKRFWNATDVCCDFDKRNINDVAYIDAIIDDMASQYRVDRKRVYLVGHSNGGFMSHRYACDRAERVAAVVSLAGDNYTDAVNRCKPSQPVALLQVHGTKDDAVPYQGGTEPGTGRTLPSALDSVTFWAKVAGCAAAPVSGVPDLDVDVNISGRETSVTRFSGCKPGGAAELWTIREGGHVPALGRPSWADAVWDWFAAHPKP